MKRKKPLSIAVLLLSALLLLTLCLIHVFAVPLSPYVMVLPEATVDETLTPGNTYTISVDTDYTGSDVWSWQFELFFNPDVLEGLEVRNGDLITTIKDPSAVFRAGTFNNTLGELSLTVAFFDSSPRPTTSGPGTLAYIDFTVIGYGSSDIELGDSTELLDPEAFFPIISADWPPGATEPPYGSDHIGHGYFRNTLPGDIQGDTPGTPPDGDVDRYDFFAFLDHYGSSVGDPNYNILADLQGDTSGTPPDGDVDRYDFFAFLDNYGRP